MTFNLLNTLCTGNCCIMKRDDESFSVKDRRNFVCAGIYYGNYDWDIWGGLCFQWISCGCSLFRNMAGCSLQCSRSECWASLPASTTGTRWRSCRLSKTVRICVYLPNPHAFSLLLHSSTEFPNGILAERWFWNGTASITLNTSSPS